MVTLAAPGIKRSLHIETEVRHRIAALPSAVVALSGGVDSSVVAALAAQELGSRVLAATGISASLPSTELSEIEALCRRLGLPHVAVPTYEMSRPGYVENTPDRCYHCKTELFSVLRRLADERGLTAVLDGTTADDLLGHRPGRQAALELKVSSPLAEAGAAKSDVRAIAQRLGLTNAERPSSPCLSSRIAYGLPVTADRLDRVGRAEAALQRLGFGEVRVRLHDAIARIEVPKARLAEVVAEAAVITRELRAIGFTYVTLDLAGLRSGSLLEVFHEPSRGG